MEATKVDLQMNDPHTALARLAADGFYKEQRRRRSERAPLLDWSMLRIEHRGVAVCDVAGRIESGFQNGKANDAVTESTI
jgi:hypothetical protein